MNFSVIFFFGWALNSFLNQKQEQRMLQRFIGSEETNCSPVLQLTFCVIHMENLLFSNFFFWEQLKNLQVYIGKVEGALWHKVSKP